MPDFFSPFVKRLFFFLTAIVVVLASFALGLNIGERKEYRFYGWCQNYPQMMPSHHSGLGNRAPSMNPFLPGGHGVFGKILSLTDHRLVIQGKDGTEENVLVTTSTVIRVGQETIRFQDIPTDLTQTDVAVFGSPGDNGQIDARLIRLFINP